MFSFLKKLFSKSQPSSAASPPKGNACRRRQQALQRLNEQALQPPLTARAAKVVAMRYGLGHAPSTYRTIGEAIHVSTSRAREITQNALRKLNWPCSQTMDRVTAHLKEGERTA